MRNDQSSHPATRNNDAMGFCAVLTGYAALAAIAVFFAFLLVAGHRHTAAPKQTHAAQDSTFGIEELVDLLAESAVLPADLFVPPKPRRISRAVLDLERIR